MPLVFAMLAVTALIFGVQMLDRSELQESKDKALISRIASLVVEADPDRLDPALEGRIVHVSGIVRADAPIRDNDTDVTVEALALRRSVQMYQYTGDTSFHTLHHHTAWSFGQIVTGPTIVNPDMPKNPPFAFNARTFQGAGIHLGAYHLSPVFLGALAAFRPTDLARYQQTDGNLMYIGNPESPSVGDLKVWYSDIPYPEISLIAVQRDGQLIPIHSQKTAEDVPLLRSGVMTAPAHIASIFQAIRSALWNSRLTVFVMFSVGWFCLMANLRPRTAKNGNYLSACIAGFGTLAATLPLYALSSDPGYGPVTLYVLLIAALASYIMARWQKLKARLTEKSADMRYAVSDRLYFLRHWRD